MGPFDAQLCLDLGPFLNVLGEPVGVAHACNGNPLVDESGSKPIPRAGLDRVSATVR